MLPVLPVIPAPPAPASESTPTDDAKSDIKEAIQLMRGKSKKE